MAKRAASAEGLAAVADGARPGGVTPVPGPGPPARTAGPGEAESRMLAVARASPPTYALTL
ncbi:hypothetical protein SHKM778_15700 [Streptomyces sp. KM77-8]|uniref:Uncharacterized protein n=1 Tax=Streptomyces haneummycinicus TaxID=3074435 RepID=A0AAT9HCQ0_9ACTN